MQKAAPIPHRLSYRIKFSSFPLCRYSPVLRAKDIDALLRYAADFYGEEWASVTLEDNAPFNGWRTSPQEELLALWHAGDIETDTFEFFKRQLPAQLQTSKQGA